MMTDPSRETVDRTAVYSVQPYVLVQRARERRSTRAVSVSHGEAMADCCCAAVGGCCCVSAVR